MTARWAFVFFWLSYSGGAMSVLFSPAFAGLARRARSLGLAFAAALMVHIGLVVWLGITISRVPLQGGVLWFFLLALLLAALLTSLSFGVGSRTLGRLRRPVLLLSTSYILLAFGRDFVLGALGLNSHGWLYGAEYLPFALLSLIAIPLRLGAFFRQRLDARCDAPAAELNRELATWR